MKKVDTFIGTQFETPVNNSKRLSEDITRMVKVEFETLSDALQAVSEGFYSDSEATTPLNEYEIAYGYVNCNKRLDYYKKETFNLRNDLIKIISDIYNKHYYNSSKSFSEYVTEDVDEIILPMLEDLIK